MEKEALYKLSYGVFLVATKSGDKTNACITNTCIQVANSPTRVVFAVLNTNYTCELLKESGICTISVLDKSMNFETIKHFGMQSGRDVDKMTGVNLSIDLQGVPYLGWGVCAVLSLKVLSSQDLGSHTLFVAEVIDAENLSGSEPMTYAYYQSDVKPKPVATPEKRKIVAWRCKICGYVYEGPDLPSDFVCPVCGHDASDFEPIYE